METGSVTGLRGDHQSSSLRSLRFSNDSLTLLITFFQISYHIFLLLILYVGYICAMVCEQRLFCECHFFYLVGFGDQA